MANLSYPRYRTPSGWNALLPERRASAPLEDDVNADLVVIGAGYTGVAAARHWARARPGDRIVILEASEVGEGNPGRNSGFLLEIALANDADATAIDRMQKANRLIGATMNRLRDDVFDNGIQCDIERAGTYRAAASDVGRQALEAYRAFLDSAALPYEWLTGADLESRLGTGYYRYGLYSPHCYLVQPAALIRGLVGLLPGSVTVFENTPALDLRRDGSRWRTGTLQGSVRARHVIVANNAFAKRLGLARSRVVAMYTYAGLTEPLPEAAGELTGSEDTWGLLPTHRLGSTLRRTRDNRLLIRSRYGYEHEDDSGKIGQSLLQGLLRRFPDLPVAEFEFVWGGATGFTRNGAPVWGELKPGLFVSAGCNGGGVVKGTLFGEALAKRALGEPADDIHGLFGAAGWMPPDPLRRFGFEIISRIERRQARAEM